jgi:hypothetical protein
VAATGRCAAALPALSAPERVFGLAWSNLVSFLGPTRFDVSYAPTSKLQALLPYRTLRGDEAPPHIGDMTAATNRALALAEAAKALDDRTGGRFLAVWECAMGAAEGQQGGGAAGAAARAHARALISDAALTQPLRDAAALVGIVFDYALERAAHQTCTLP